MASDDKRITKGDDPFYQNDDRFAIRPPRRVVTAETLEELRRKSRRSFGWKILRGSASLMIWGGLGSALTIVVSDFLGSGINNTKELSKGLERVLEALEDYEPELGRTVGPFQTWRYRTLKLMVELMEVRGAEHLIKSVAGHPTLEDSRSMQFKFSGISGELRNLHDEISRAPAPKGEGMEKKKATILASLEYMQGRMFDVELDACGGHQNGKAGSAR